MHTTNRYQNLVRHSHMQTLEAKRLGGELRLNGSHHSVKIMREAAMRGAYRAELEASDEFHWSPALDRLEHFARTGRRIPATCPDELDGDQCIAWYQRRLAGSEYRWQWVVIGALSGKVVQLVEHPVLWTLREIAAHYSRLDTRCLKGH
jgi:hypothetical protein